MLVLLVVVVMLQVVSEWWEMLLEEVKIVLETKMLQRCWIETGRDMKGWVKIGWEMRRRECCDEWEKKSDSWTLVITNKDHTCVG